MLSFSLFLLRASHHLSVFGQIFCFIRSIGAMKTVENRQIDRVLDFLSPFAFTNIFVRACAVYACIAFPPVKYTRARGFVIFFSLDRPDAPRACIFGARASRLHTFTQLFLFAEKK